MKIKNVEIRDLPQLVLVQYRYPSSLHLQDVLAAQLLDHSVYVNNTGADGIGEECLSEREAEGQAVRPTDCFQSGVKFDHKMGYTARRVALANVADPLAEDCSIGQGIAPKRLGDLGPDGYELAQCSMRNKAENAAAHGRNIMVHDMKEQALQVRNVARLVKGQNLAPTMADDLRSQNKALREEAGCRRPVSARDDWFPATRSFHGDGQTTDDGLTLVVDFSAD